MIKISICSFSSHVSNEGELNARRLEQYGLANCFLYLNKHRAFYNAYDVYLRKATRQNILYRFVEFC